jgi:hypothetical protein
MNLSNLMIDCRVRPACMICLRGCKSSSQLPRFDRSESFKEVEFAVEIKVESISSFFFIIALSVAWGVNPGHCFA